jgi:hypothetical protein
MAGKGKGSAAAKVTKSAGRQAAGRRKADPYDPRLPEDDPYRDLRVPEDDPDDPAGSEYIWPEYDDEDEDRV